MSNGTAVSASLFKSLPFDAQRDFAPVSTLGYFDLAVLAAPNAPYKTMADLLAYESEQELAPGTLVRVPLGRREVPGVVWPEAAGEGGLPEGVSLKPVREALTCLPPLPAAWRALVDFTARYYQRALGEVALSVLPPELRKLDDAGLGKRIRKLQKKLGMADPAAFPDAPRRAAAAGAAVA
eukprot:gene13401-17802_t